MKKVLVLIHTPTFGGPHNQVLRLNAGLLERGIEQIVVVPKDSDDSFTRLKDAGVNVMKGNLRRVRRPGLVLNNLRYLLFFWKDIKFIRNLIVQHRIDVVQVCGLMHLHGAIAGFLSKKRVVWQLLSSTFVPRPYRDLLCFFVKYLADCVMVVGSHTLKKHPFHKSFPNVIKFYPPVDEKKFVPNPPVRKKVREALSIDKSDIVIGTVGNHVKPKAHERIMELVDEMVDSNPQVKFVIAGKHDDSHAAYYKNEVIRRYEKLENRSKVLFSSDLEVSEVLQAFDIFLLSSSTEGLPTVVLEAICCGLPIVTTNVGSVSEVVDQTNGIIVSNYDHQQMVAALTSLTSSTVYLEKMAEGGLAIRNKFFLEECVSKHCQAYGQESS
ncbi:glycosyltransferase family 4 protein [Ekhidna sp. MALMAid0563]|uniref:glycosyltransferase family 4 protein n=1 Tax=Ekhidna sp. MALMAid0563 TaxID=3143937 RepID=UPI0032DF6AD7